MKQTMSRRERVLAALDHRQTDFVPYHADYTTQEHEKVADYLGDPDFEGKQGYHLYYTQYMGAAQPIPGKAEFFRDDFGVVWNRSGADKDIGVIERPFVCDLEDYHFPEVRLDEDALHREYRAMMADKGDRFTFAGIGFTMFERAWSLCGMENVLMAMLLNPEALDALLDDICAFDMRVLDIALSYDFDAIYFGDDWGQQRGLIMGAKHWRRFIKPRMAMLYARVKERGLRVIQHSCGDIAQVLPDLIEIGLDCYQTFQPEIYDIEAVKAAYGDRLTFWGGISTQQLLPFATPEQVKIEVARLIGILGEGGGYIAAPTHAVPADVPPANIVAMNQALRGQRG